MEWLNKKKGERWRDVAVINLRENESERHAVCST